MIRRLARKALRRALHRPDASSSPAPARPTSAPVPPRRPVVAPPLVEAPAIEAQPVDEAPPPDVEVDHTQLKAWREEGRPLLILDIREAMEVRNGVLEGSTWIPMNSVPSQLDSLPRDRTLVVVCAAGMRSFGVAHYLREQGLDDAWSLVGGVGAGVSAGIPWQAEGPR